MNIYLDMDDVVADWMQYARQIVKRDWNYGQRIPDSDWKQLQQDQRFYRHLSEKEGAQELVAWCRNYVNTHAGSTLQFLTAIPHDYTMPYAANDKVWWAHEHFPGIPVFIGPFSHDKWRYCKGPDDILIDDRLSNNQEWQAQGGRSHLYRTWKECKLWLEETLK